jgi:hypothetical protein
MNYYCSLNGTEVVGPYSLEDIKKEFLRGSFPPATQVCVEGTQDWQRLISLIQPSKAQATQPPLIFKQAQPSQSVPQQATQKSLTPYAVKVLTTKDRFFSGKFDPEKLEAAINSYAAEGWSVVACDSAEFAGFLGDRSELITVMHKIGGRMKKYKILTQKDRFFGGKFDPEKLESAINSYVSEGWQVRAITSATFPGFGSSREEMIVVLEKEV